MVDKEVDKVLAHPLFRSECYVAAAEKVEDG